MSTAATNEITELIACPECGETSWVDYESNRETMRLRIHTNADQPIWATQKSVYYDTVESEGWKCENGHSATDDIFEALLELRGEIDFID